MQEKASIATCAIGTTLTNIQVVNSAQTNTLGWLNGYFNSLPWGKNTQPDS